MIDARLQVALDGGGLILPQEGRIAVFRPSVEARLTTLPHSRCDFLHDFKPFLDHWASNGFQSHHSAAGPYAAAILCLPRAKAEARALIAQAAAECDGPLIFDGQKTDGVDSILKEVRRVAPVMGPISKAHGKLFWIENAKGLFADWHQGPALTPGGFWTAPGVFSADAVDLASALLAEALPQDISGDVADLGAGWGFLSAHVLTRPGVKSLHLVEAGHMALECARRNVTDPRAAYHWADATRWEPPSLMDAVVMNPPFHTGRAAQPQIGQAFVAAAARILSPKGQLWMVANRHLPYESELTSRFAQVQELGGDARFKLFYAARPLRQRK